MKRSTLLFLFVFLSMCVTNISISQVVNTPPLSPEEAEAVKPLKKTVEGWHKKDMELFMSAYHEKAIIEMSGGGKVNKDKLRKILHLGGVDMSVDVEKIEITGEKATILGITKLGGKVIPRKLDLVKQGDSWFIIGQWLR
jgi:hypothetical protein